MNLETIPEEKLRCFSIFDGLTDEELRRVQSKVSVVRFERGETIIAHEARDTDVYLLLDGQVLANRYSLAGREISYRRLPPNSYFGELAVFDGEPRSVNIVAMTEVLIGRLSGPAFSDLMAAIPSISKALLRDMGARIRELSDRIYVTTASSVKMRFYNELIRNAMALGGGDGEIVLKDPPTHAEWAATVGGQRETITRAISELTSLGLLRKQGRNLVITNLHGLMDQVEEV
ncbi:Crp/Fnr family transcriptional regulator [Erythrobacter sp. SCSIO 43205]|uniref:Crp/Fnr family transcriptional regulator n=1 Tax=Erythrobacter sp. SCSIO 43205 TaxID=2779361 RepID=UPI001CA8DF7B|nr:Crp/Fnr family transcriptional regulator [Erythrobacter sp. SCSIO 43205]UAB79372.1 Crp/Fnr family transcriptional regulator [Erythrobacter sp. SCSIO 43205]